MIIIMQHICFLNEIIKKIVNFPLRRLSYDAS